MALKYNACGYGNTPEQATKRLKKQLARVDVSKFSVGWFEFGPTSEPGNRTDHRGKVWAHSVWARLEA